MSYSRLSAPGSQYGPCKDGCVHPDCAATRTMAETPCRYCKEPIGYGRSFTQNDAKELCHFDCLLKAIDEHTD